MYYKAAVLSMRMWTDIASLSFNVKNIIANLAALSSKTFMWQLTPQSCNEASELVFIWGGGEIKDLPLQRGKFSFHDNGFFSCRHPNCHFLLKRVVTN